VLGTIRTVTTVLEMVNGPLTVSSPNAGTHLPILGMHIQYIQNQYEDAVNWNNAHPANLSISNSSLVAGLNRELGLNQSLAAYQQVWARPKGGIIDERS
jgi:hypothetical protein